MKNFMVVFLLVVCLSFLNVSAGGGGGAIPELITSSELVGTWACSAFASISRAGDSLVDDDWIISGEGDMYLQYIGGLITFNDDGDGTFSIALQNQDPLFLVETNLAETSSYAIVADVLYCTSFALVDGQTYPIKICFQIKKLRANSYVLSYIDGGDFAAKVIVLDRI